MKFVLYADAHFRSTVPEARLDDYLANQDKTMKWLKEEFYDYTHIVAGDIVHLARERSEPLTFAYELSLKLPHMVGVWGNHDLLYHNRELTHKTTLGMLERMGIFTALPDDGTPVVFAEEDTFGPVRIFGFHYGQEMEKPKLPKGKRNGTNIAVYHGMVLQEEDPHINGVTANELLENFPEYDIILTGDNHKQFVVVNDNRILINPGSLKRDNADQVDHNPMVFTYDSETNKVDRVPVPIEDDIIDREHLDVKIQRDERLEKLADKFQEARGITLDFYDNVVLYLKDNDVSDTTELRVLEWIS
jgi:predicted phosphodiesterase